ncbi:Doublecortin domain-containing protein 2 [Cricetulus griseus]|nr:Doublecortin domain-containing protein 2 [Cricetulus griseus]
MANSACLSICSSCPPHANSDSLSLAVPTSTHPLNSRVALDTSITLPYGFSHVIPLERPAEIVDEEEDGEKTNKDIKQKEDFSAMNGETEDGGSSEATDAPKQEEGIPDHAEKKASPSRVNGTTDEENGEELDQVTEELQPTVDEEGKAEGDNSGQDKADSDAQRPPRPEVTITSPQENEENEQNKDSSAVA